MKKIIIALIAAISFSNISFAEYHPDEQWFPIYDNYKAGYYLNIKYIYCRKLPNHELVDFWTMTYNKETGLIMRAYATEDLCCRLESLKKIVVINPNGTSDTVDAPSVRWEPLKDEAGSSRAQISYLLKHYFDNTIYGKPLLED